MEKIIEAFVTHFGDGFVPHLITHCTIAFALFVLTIGAVLLDLGFAVSTAKQLGEKVRSHKLRRTIIKILLYWGCQLMAFILGFSGVFISWYNLPYLTIVVSIGVYYTEYRSMREHAKRRKDGVAKLPENIQDLVDFVGGVDEARDALKGIAMRRVKSGWPTNDTNTGTGEVMPL